MWSSDLPTILRYLIDDVDEPFKYSDDRLLGLLLVSAQLIQTETPIATAYAVNVDNQTLSPDPTLTASRDDGFINLMVLKAACILASSSYQKGYKQAISIQDGPSKIDLTNNLSGLKLFVDNFCGTYERAKVEYVRGVNIVGEAIIGPYKVGFNNVPYIYDPRVLRPTIF